MRSTPRSSSPREWALCAVVLLLLSYSWMFSQVSVPNERTRVYLTVALVDHGTLAVDEPLRRFGRVTDLAQFEGRYFTDKAPGSSLMAAPIYAAARLFTEPEDWTIVDLCNLFRSSLMVPLGLLGFVLMRSILRRLAMSEPAVDVTSLAFSVASPMLHYSTVFYGHVIVAVLILAALRLQLAAGLFDRDAGTNPRMRFGALLGAGACAGLAGLVEYQATVVGVLLALPVLWAPRGARLQSAVAYGLGAVPFAAVLLAYNALAFGGPFELSYHHLVREAMQELHGVGLAGATRPTWKSVHGMLFSQHRGLLVTTPFLAVGLCALPFVTTRMPLRLWVPVALCTIYFVLIVASSNVWFGGWSFGLRLLIPVLGCLALFAAYAFDFVSSRWPAATVLLRAMAIYGFVYQLSLQVTFPELPPKLLHPWADAVGPMLRAGVVAPNLACKLFPLGPANLIPLAVPALAVVLVLALRGLGGERRLLQGAASIGVAGLALALLAQSAPSAPPRERTKWDKFVKTRAETETRCSGQPPER